MSKDKILEDINLEIIEEYLYNIASYDRLSGSEGEAQAIDYIINELEKEGIEYKINYTDAILSNPVSAKLFINYEDEIYNIPAKTRSFSASTENEDLKGQLIYISEEKLIKKPIEWQFKKKTQKKDLMGKIVISEAANPISILDIQSRGAIGYIQYWIGDEDLIHEGAVNPIWGTPKVNELEYYLKIPVICINNKEGENLLYKLKNTDMHVSINTKVEKSVTKIPTLEAFINSSKSNNEEYLLVGSHLDSWYFGATDNGTGNAIGLYIAKKFNEIKDELNFGLKIAWWSGHSNGRYAGSSLYARENYKDLLQSCIAYMNIDMPGLRGATDYTKISSGIEIVDLAQSCIKDVVNQQGEYSGPIRGWDQSFQNIGITPYFIWSSVLRDNHPDTTGNSFMSWWWHTEEDKLKYYDKNVLLDDVKIYLLAIKRLITSDMKVFDITKLLEKVFNRLVSLNKRYNTRIDLSKSVKEFEEMKKTFNLSYDKGLNNKEILYILKKINQIYYTVGESYQQDFALEQDEVPGFDNLIFLEKYSDDEYYLNILLNELLCQQNRVISICSEITILLESKF